MSVNSFAQQITITDAQNVTIKQSYYDKCNSIILLNLTITDKYYFGFNVLLDGVALTSSQLKFEGDASGFISESYKNVICNKEYSGDTIFYMSLRNGAPYILTSVAPSLDDLYFKLIPQGDILTVTEGAPISITGTICPANENYTYQWYENDEAIEGATSINLSSYVPKVNNGKYTLKVKVGETLISEKSLTFETIKLSSRFTFDNWYGFNLSSSKVYEMMGTW